MTNSTILSMREKAGAEYDLRDEELDDDAVHSSVHSRLALFTKHWRSRETGLVFPPVHFWNNVIIPPESRRYQFWIYVVLICAIYSSFFTPIEFGFFRGLPKNLWWIDQANQFMFMIDIVLNFFVAFKDRHTYKWVLDHESIALRYAKSDFIPDILSCLPWDAIYMRTGKRELVRYLLWIRLYRIRKVETFFRRRERDIRINYLFTRIVKLITVELYCTHTAACIFYYLATTLPPSQEQLTWIGSLTLGGYDFENFRHIDFGRRYVVSLYFAIVTMATVGYGDIHAVNTREMVFVMIFVSFDMILGAYLIGNMTALIVKGSNTEKFRDKMTALIKYMNRNQLEKDLRAQLKNHLRLQYECQFVEDSVVHDLPFSIRSKVARSLYMSTIERVLIFRNCSLEFISQIARRVHEEYFLPGEVILEQGCAADQIYFVQYGSLLEVVVNLDGSEETITNLEAESVFGEVAVLCSIPQPFTVRVCELSKVLRIDKESFFHIMEVYFTDGRKVLDNLLKFKSARRASELETDINFLIDEKEVELTLKANNAAYHGQLSHLKSLIKSGADPNRPDYDGRTALHLAAGNGHEEIVAFLLKECTVDVNAEDRFGNTPLIEATRGSHFHAIRALRLAGAKFTEQNAGNHLRLAVSSGNLDFVKNLLENGMNPNCSDPDGRTALHVAASRGMTTMAEVLMKHGANMHAKDRWGKTPIDESKKIGSEVFNNLFQSAVQKKRGTPGSFGKAIHTQTLTENDSYDTLIQFGCSDEERDRESTHSGPSEIISTSQPRQEGTEKCQRRCTVFACAPTTPLEDRRYGLAMWVPDNIQELLRIASDHFDETFTHVLNQDMGQILTVELIHDSDKVYVVNGG